MYIISIRSDPRALFVLIVKAIVAFKLAKGALSLPPSKAYLEPSSVASSSSSSGSRPPSSTGLAKRVIACLDVRSNDQGDLVVTKVRQKKGS